MAAISLPAPGTEYGPCKDDCEHVDCQLTRKQAGEHCPFCETEIGYETRFYNVSMDENDHKRLAHARCYEDSINLKADASLY